MAQNIREKISIVRSTIRDLKICQHEPSTELTKHYGFIKFDENPLESTTRLSQYIRLSLDTTAETVIKFIKEGWKLTPPNLIISVTGGAKHCKMSVRLRKIFQSGLVSAAMTTNAWIITAGTNAGVVKEVGEALNNYRYKNRKRGLDVPCIGIGSWGYTAGKDQLGDRRPGSSSMRTNTKPSRSTTSQTETLHALTLDIPDRSLFRNYVVKQKEEKRCDLEPNHTHFLLFDDGEQKADNVLSIRADIERLCRHVNQNHLNGETSETLIPIVMILVEGGPSSIKTICEALISKTPVVIVKDSGRAADLVAELHACYSDNDSSSTAAQPGRPPTSFSRVGPKLGDINGILTKAAKENPWVNEVKDHLCRVLSEHKKLVTVFKFDSKRHKSTLEDTILEALFNAAQVEGDSSERNRRKAELKLAMAWNKFEYAQHYLLTDATISSWEEIDIRHALVDALRHGLLPFVELLIEFGTLLENLTHADLANLYATNSGSRLPVKTKSKYDVPKLNDYYADYFKKISRIVTANNNSTGEDVPMRNIRSAKLLQHDPANKTQLGKNAARELFLWALFLNRVELATYLCSKTWNSTTAALIGAHVFRRASRLTLDPDIKNQYDKHAQQFDNFAMELVDRCFDCDENFAVDLLKRPSVAFEDVDLLKLAQTSDCQSFLASKCVQRYLDNEWFGCINYKRKAINFRVFLTSLFLPLLPIFCVLLPYIKKHQKIEKSIIDSPRLDRPEEASRDSKPAQQKKDPVPLIDKIIYFYQAPIVRFYYYTIFFVTFLLLYSFVLLVDYFPLNIYNGRRSGIQNLQIPVTEIFLHICVWSLVLEEARQLLTTSSKREYISEIWNMVDILGIALYLIGFITRFVVNEAAFTVSKIFLCLDLIVWFVRTLHLFAAYEKLGPKLVMIFNTMKDLLFFVCFIFIFLYAFSIASMALISTNDQVTWNYVNETLVNVTITNGGSGLWTWDLIRNVTNYGVWKIFGQVDPIDGSNAYSIIAFVLAIFFLAIANVLLLNVLVALFNLTIQHVHEQSHHIWRYQRFLIVSEYSGKPPLPPPFSIIYYVFLMVRFLFRKIRACCRQRGSVANQSLLVESLNSLDDDNMDTDFNITDAMRRESAIAEDYWKFVLKHGNKDDIHITLENIDHRLQDLTEKLRDANSYSTQTNNETFHFEKHSTPINN